MPGASTAAPAEPRIKSVQIKDADIVAHLTDGRTISVPLSWSWRLTEASHEQRANYRLIGSGTGIRWQAIDEDISLHGMLHGIPDRRPT